MEPRLIELITGSGKGLSKFESIREDCLQPYEGSLS